MKDDQELRTINNQHDQFSFIPPPKKKLNLEAHKQIFGYFYLQ